MNLLQCKSGHRKYYNGEAEHKFEIMTSYGQLPEWCEPYYFRPDFYRAYFRKRLKIFRDNDSMNGTPLGNCMIYFCRQCNCNCSFVLEKKVVPEEIRDNLISKGEWA